MGITDYVGHVDVVPALTGDDIELLRGLRKSRHRGSAEPAGRSPWVPCDDGCCLSASGRASSGSAAAWLRYLIRRHLAAHVLDGKVAGSHRDDRELFVIAVRDNRVRERVLHPGRSSPQYAAAPVPRPRRTGARRSNVIYLDGRRRPVP
jgi:hypothetical protein